MFYLLYTYKVLIFWSTHSLNNDVYKKSVVYKGVACPQKRIVNQNNCGEYSTITKKRLLDQHYLLKMRVADRINRKYVKQLFYKG